MEHEALLQQIEALKKEKAELEKNNQTLSAENKTLQTEKEKLQDQIKKDLERFEADKAEQEEKIEELENVQEEYKKYKQNVKIDNIIRDNKAKNVKAIRALIDFHQVEFLEDGQIKGLDDQIEAIKKSDAYLFDLGTKQEYNPNGGQADEPRVKMPELNEFRIVK